jgi:carbon storage regulator
MLVLSRKIGEVITVGASVKITVLSFDRGVVRLGIDAPKSIPVHRKEVYDKIIELNKQSAKTNISALKNVMSSYSDKFKGTAEKPTVAATLDALTSSGTKKK